MTDGIIDQLGKLLYKMKINVDTYTKTIKIHIDWDFQASKKELIEVYNILKEIQGRDD